MEKCHYCMNDTGQGIMLAIHCTSSKCNSNMLEDFKLIKILGTSAWQHHHYVTIWTCLTFFISSYFIFSQFVLVLPLNFNLRQMTLVDHSLNFHLASDVCDVECDFHHTLQPWILLHTINNFWLYCHRLEYPISPRVGCLIILWLSQRHSNTIWSISTSLQRSLYLNNLPLRSIMIVHIICIDLSLFYHATKGRVCFSF